MGFRLEPPEFTSIIVVAIELPQGVGGGEFGLRAREPKYLACMQGERERGKGRDANGRFHGIYFMDGNRSSAASEIPDVLRETGDVLRIPERNTKPCLALGVGAYEVSCRARATKCSRCRSTVRPPLPLSRMNLGPPFADDVRRRFGLQRTGRKVAAGRLGSSALRVRRRCL